MPNIHDFLHRQEHLIDTVGWPSSTYCPPTTTPTPPPPFAHTVGLIAQGYPGLLVAGLAPDVAHALLNNLARRVYDRRNASPPGNASATRSPATTRHR